MKKMIILLFAISISSFISSDEAHRKEIEAFQKELNQSYLDADESPLSAKQRRVFKKNEGHRFFPINEKFRVTAKLEKPSKAQAIKMGTSAGRVQMYSVFAIAHFEIDGKAHKLNIYQSYTLRKTKEYADYLFLPFTDQTSGSETYGGGRYIDLKVTDAKTLVIDFNKAYQPYCAYTTGYSCPIPPKQNHLEVSIEAGVKSLDYELK